MSAFLLWCVLLIVAGGLTRLGERWGRGRARRKELDRLRRLEAGRAAQRGYWMRDQK